MIDNQNFQMSMYCAGSSYEDGIIEHDLFYEEFGFQYFTGNFEPDGFDCLRDKFIGPYRTEDNPIAVEKGQCGGSFELGNNHCGSLQKNRRKGAPGVQFLGGAFRSRQLGQREKSHGQRG